MSARGRTARDVALALGALFAATALAELLGAANMGIALSFGVFAFTATLVWAMLSG